MGAVESDEGGGGGGGLLLFPLADGGRVNNRSSLSGQMGLSEVPGILSTASVVIWKHTLSEKPSQTRTQTHISSQAANIFHSALKCGEAQSRRWRANDVQHGTPPQQQQGQITLHFLETELMVWGRNHKSCWPNTVISTLQRHSGLLFYRGVGLLVNYYSWCIQGVKTFRSLKWHGINQHVLRWRVKHQ